MIPYIENDKTSGKKKMDSIHPPLFPMGGGTVEIVNP